MRILAIGIMLLLLPLIFLVLAFIMWMLGMALNQEWMMYPMAWAAQTIFWIAGHRT